MEISNKHLLVATIATVLSSGAVQGMDMSNQQNNENDTRTIPLALSPSEINEMEVNERVKSEVVKLLNPKLVECLLQSVPNPKQEEILVCLCMTAKQKVLASLSGCYHGTLIIPESLTGEIQAELPKMYADFLQNKN